MDIEQIIFLIIALLLSVFSMYKKSKKKQKTVSQKEESYQDFQQPANFYYPQEPVVNLEQSDVSKLLQNFDIHTKKNKKKQKQQNIEPVNIQEKKATIFLQDADSKSDISLLEDFDGTEIQKAFLYSEIFKNTKN